jgi:hypothetical protein
VRLAVKSHKKTTKNQVWFFLMALDVRYGSLTIL